LLTVVGKQKDATRKEEDGFLRNAKIVIMNEEFLKESKDTSQTARVIGTVNKAIEEVKPQKIDVKGKDLVGKFLSNQLSQLNALEKYAQKTKETDFSVMSSDEIAKSVNSSVSSVKKAVKFEKYSQDIAKEIKKDKEAMDIVSKSPLIADVEEKASGNHAEWLDVAYKNSAVKDDFLTEVVEKSVMAEKKKLAVFATSDELKPTLNSSVKAKLNKLKKETMQMFAGKKSSETKPNTNAKPEDIVWNRAFNKTGR
jgi:hypothetical protein